MGKEKGDSEALSSLVVQLDRGDLPIGLLESVADVLDVLFARLIGGAGWEGRGRISAGVRARQVRGRSETHGVARLGRARLGLAGRAETLLPHAAGPVTAEGVL